MSMNDDANPTPTPPAGPIRREWTDSEGRKCVVKGGAGMASIAIDLIYNDDAIGMQWPDALRLAHALLTVHAEAVVTGLTAPARSTEAARASLESALTSLELVLEARPTRCPWWWRVRDLMLDLTTAIEELDRNHEGGLTP